MNHCLIQAVIYSAPQMRYTKENQTAIAEMIVNFKGLRKEDPTRNLKIIGWGNIAQEMVNELKEGQNIVIEGRLNQRFIKYRQLMLLILIKKKIMSHLKIKKALKNLVGIVHL